MLVHGCRHRPLALSGTRHYLPEEILRLCKRRRGPLWLHVEDAYVPVKRTDDVLLFACEVAAAYHEGVSCSTRLGSTARSSGVKLKRSGKGRPLGRRVFGSRSSSK